MAYISRRLLIHLGGFPFGPFALLTSSELKMFSIVFFEASKFSSVKVGFLISKFHDKTEWENLFARHQFVRLGGSLFISFYQYFRLRSCSI